MIETKEKCGVETRERRPDEGTTTEQARKGRLVTIFDDNGGSDVVFALEWVE